MLEIRENKCPHCGAPAEADNRTCNYCYAKISRHGDDDGQATMVCGIMFAVVCGLLAIDWYYGIGLTAWLVETCQQLSAAMN